MGKKRRDVKWARGRENLRLLARKTHKERLKDQSGEGKRGQEERRRGLLAKKSFRGSGGKVGRDRGGGLGEGVEDEQEGQLSINI